MTRRRFIADEFSTNRAFLIGDHADHLIKVLRARVGQEFEIVTGGVVHLGRILTIHDHEVEFALGEEVPAASPLPVTLAIAIFKFDRMEWAIEKGTELGVSRIVPLIARRTDPHLAEAAVKRVQRWQRIAREASEQSRRISPPEITQPTKLNDVILIAGDTRVVLAESETQLTLKKAIHDRQGDLVLAVGPEGGWTNDEVRSFANAGWISASVGETILRVETAAIVGIAIVASELSR
jgi:16S rRNA (uracil1498-N3)-methyltransferase